MSKWKMVKLGDVGLIVTGNTPPTKNIEYYENADIAFYKPNDLKEYTVSKLDKAYMAVDNRAKEKLRILPTNSVLVTCIGTIGKVGVSTNVECATNQQINAIIPKCELCDGMYLAYAIFSKQKYMQDIANAPVVPIINKSDFSKIEIPLPPLEEQKKIAAELDKINELIAKRKKQIEKLDLLVKSQFVEMFGDPVTNPMGWKSGTIRNIVSEVKYGTSKPAVKGGKYFYLRMNNITYDGRLDLSNLKNIDIADNEFEKCAVRKGDVLFNRTNSKELVGKTCVYDLNEAMVIAGYIIRIRVNNKAVPIYLSAVLNSRYGKGTLFDMCKAIVGQANINAQELQDIKILIPPIHLQNQFADFVTKVEQTKDKMQIALSKLETLYKARMQEYFS